MLFQKAAKVIDWCCYDCELDQQFLLAKNIKNID
jgi:hypothetical protein